MKSSELPKEAWIFIIVLAFLMIIGLPGGLMFAWNMSVPEVFPGVEQLTYWRAFWMICAVNILTMPMWGRSSNA